jgi:hypothetical protein
MWQKVLGDITIENISNVIRKLCRAGDASNNSRSVEVSTKRYRSPIA